MSTEEGVTFTLPPGYAERMTQKSGEFYLDVFGAVRDAESCEQIGVWGYTGMPS